jgi:preprotein translocase subunit YajC
VDTLVGLLPIIAIALIFWLLIIRPQTRRQRELLQMQSALSAGDEVLLSSGVFGTVVAIADTHLMVSIAPGVEIKVARGAVAQIVRDEPTEAPRLEGDEPGESAGPADTEER